MHDTCRWFRAVPLVAGAALLAAGPLHARVTKITIDSTTAVQGGQVFPPVGAYELVRFTAYGEVDPADRRNAGITDIQSATKNAAGKVAYISQGSIHKPVDLSQASGILTHVVPNRG